MSDEPCRICGIHKDVHGEIPGDHDWTDLGTDNYCNLHHRHDCTLCDECGHDGGLHINAWADNLPAIFGVATCWAENLCLACLRNPGNRCPDCGRHFAFGPISDCATCAAEPSPMDVLYPLRLPITPPEEEVIRQAVLEDDWKTDAERELALQAALICDACGWAADPRDPTVLAFHQAEITGSPDDD